MPPLEPSVSTSDTTYLSQLRQVNAEDRDFQRDLIRIKSEQDKAHAAFQAALASSQQVANSGR